MLLKLHFCTTTKSATKSYIFLVLFIVLQDSCKFYFLLIYIFFQAFATLENLKLMCSSDKIFLDGTFKANPRMFKQLYTIHGKYCGQIFPLIFCLLPDKSQATYQRLFTNLKNIANSQGMNFQMKNAMMDFESAAMKTFEKVFPQTALKGCFFH